MMRYFLFTKLLWASSKSQSNHWKCRIGEAEIHHNLFREKWNFSGFTWVTISIFRQSLNQYFKGRNAFINVISFHFLENLIHILINRCQNISTMGLNVLSNTINIKLKDMFPNCFYNSIKCQILQNRGSNILLFPLSLPKDHEIIMSWIV